MSQPFPPQQPYQSAGQPYPQPTPYDGGGQGQLVVNLRKPFGLLSYRMMTPVVTIDGYPAPAHWEQNSYPVSPGRHLVHCSTRYLFEYGHAEQPVDVAPGQSVEVHYSTPLMTFSQGRMGFEQQSRAGVLAFWLILSVPIALLLVIFVAIALIAAGSS